MQSSKNEESKNQSMLDLALSIGTSLNLEKNSEFFFEKLSKNLKLQKCALVLPNNNTNQASFIERYVYGDSSRNSFDLQHIETAKFIAGIEKNLIVVIDKNSTQAQQEACQAITNNQCTTTFYWLKNLGFIYLSHKEQKPKKVVRINEIIHFFGSSIQGCLLHEMTMLEIEKRKEAEEKANQANLSKSQFLANMSHEIRTPLNGIIGSIDLVLETNMTKDQKNLLAISQKSSEILLSVINDILDFSKSQSTNFSLKKEEFNINDLIYSVVSSILPTANEKNVHIIVDAPPLVDDVYLGDEIRIKQILNNLINNAVKFTDNGEVNVILKTNVNKNKHQFCFEIVDTGIGIHEKNISRLFEMFYQVDSSSTKKHKGTGLGLAISKKLCQLMGGDISVVSKNGTGTTFKFDIIVEKAISNNEKPIIRNSFQGRKATIVEDNIVNLKIIESQLAFMGFITKSFLHPKEFISSLSDSSQLTDLFLLDMQMPELNGCDVARKIRSKPQFKETPIILSSSISSVTEISETDNLIFSDKLYKPMSTTDLHSAIQSAFAENNNKPSYLNQINQYSFSKDSCLIVEDNLINQQILKAMLEKLGMQPTIANHGLEALDYLKENPTTDIVFMDIQMPTLNGIEALAQLKKLEINTPFYIALTANALKGDREHYLNCGFDAYLSKPYTLHRIKQTLSLRQKTQKKAM